MQVMQMLYEDKYGNIRMPEEVEEMAIWEIEELEIHVTENLQ